MLLETFTARDGSQVKLPDFISVEKEVTHDPSYSMFNLSLKSEFLNHCGDGGDDN
jgi:hypothetical protein